MTFNFATAAKQVHAEAGQERLAAKLDFMALRYETDDAVKAKMDNAVAKYVSDQGYDVVETPDRIVFVNKSGEAPSEDVQWGAKFLAGGEDPVATTTAHGSSVIAFNKTEGADYDKWASDWHSGNQIDIHQITDAQLHETIAAIPSTGTAELQGPTLVPTNVPHGAGVVRGAGECCIFNEFGGGGCGECNRGSAGAIPHNNPNPTLAKIYTSQVPNQTSFTRSMNPNISTTTGTSATSNPFYQEISTSNPATEVPEVKKDITLTPEQYEELTKAKQDKEDMMKQMEDLQNERKTDILNSIFTSETVKDEQMRKVLFDKYFKVKDIKVIKDLYTDFNTHIVPRLIEKVKAETEPKPEEKPAEEPKTEEKKQSAGSLKPEPKVEKTVEQPVRRINEAAMIHKLMFGDF